MFTWFKPTITEINDYVLGQHQRPFSYSAVGRTRGAGPSGYNHDRQKIRLGTGEKVFQQASDALGRWQMFPTEICQVCWPNAPIEEGTIVAALFRAGPLWSLNPCRIVYTFDERDDAGRRFGFAYGTLPDHVECGEERFEVRWDRQDDSVWYELSCFSRPQHRLARLGFPYVRFVQARFRRLSAAAMKRAVSTDTCGPSPDAATPLSAC